MLHNIERDRGILLLHVMVYNEEERDADALDGPFPTASWEAAQSLMKRYIEEYPDDDWSESYWKINLYTSEDLHEHQTAQLSVVCGHQGRRAHIPPRSAQSPHSQIACRKRLAKRKQEVLRQQRTHLYAVGTGRHPQNRRSPFDRRPRFAIVLENGYEHTAPGQIWCAGPSKDHGVKEGSLSSGTYSDSLLDPFIPLPSTPPSAIPATCRTLRLYARASQKLHDNPDYGKQWSEGSVGHDCLQPYRKPANQSELDIHPDIFEFLDSRSIKEHLQRINYELTTPVAASSSIARIKRRYSKSSKAGKDHRQYAQLHHEPQK